MKSSILKMTTALALAFALMLPSAAIAQSGGQRTDNERKEERTEKNERHPAIRAAIKALERAKYDLEHADHDFGGHRAEALESVNRAMEQLKLALQYDKK